MEKVYNDEKDRYVPKCVKTEYVDGERIKADACSADAKTNKK